MPKYLLGLVLTVLLLAAASPALAGGVDAQDAFEQLKSLAGTWNGKFEGHAEAAEAEAADMGKVVHEFRVSAAGTVLMETMAPGTEHEMINMYHVDGDDLVLTHYCAGGNQPHMRLNRDQSTKQMLVFDFAGGTNLDPAVDEFIHSAKITLVDDQNVESMWGSRAGGKEAGAMTFHLARSR